MSDRILALDLGSSALKAVLFDRGGAAVASATAAYPTRGGPDGAQEQDPEAWWAAAIDACAALPATERARVAAVVPVGTMENLVVLDGEGRPVRPAMLYSDARGAAAFAAWSDAAEATGAAAILGNAPEPLMTAFKFGWLRAAEPGAAAATRLILPGAKDVLALRLAGEAATDPVTATTTGLMDLARRDWSAPLAASHGIALSLLPAIHPVGRILGPLLPRAAAAIGLPAGIPVVNGSGDAGASTMGAETGAEGEAHLYLGTTGWVARGRVLDPAILPRPFYSLAHPEPGRVIEIAPILSAGDAAAWFGGIAGTEIDLLDAQAAAFDVSPPTVGRAAPLFLPYLKGERSPFVDLALRGAFLGLDAGHGRAVLHHAVLEGVAAALAVNLEALGATTRLRLTGGGGRSRIWPQLIADICDVPVEVLDLPAAATAFGGYRIAAATLGWPVPVAPSARRFLPRPDRRARAAARLALFRRATAELRALATLPWG